MSVSGRARIQAQVSGFRAWAFNCSAVSPTLGAGFTTRNKKRKPHFLALKSLKCSRGHVYLCGGCLNQVCEGLGGPGTGPPVSVHCSLATEDISFHKLTPFDCLVHQMFAETGADKIHSGARKVC